MKEPNFLIIGAPKSGTTSLYHYLSQHPDVFMSSNKEPKFFALENCPLNFKGTKNGISAIKGSGITTYLSYLKLFENADNFRAVGEASPMYLHSEKAPERIKYYFPNMKLIAILRNPVVRLYSDWKHAVRMGYEPKKNIMKAVKAWEFRKKDNYLPYLNYLHKGFYFQHLKRYYNFFAEDQIKIFLYEELTDNANQLLFELLRFIDVDPNIKIDTTIKYMKSTPIVKNKNIDSFVSLILKLTQKKHVRIIERLLGKENINYFVGKISKINRIEEEVPWYVYKEFIKIYREDIFQLQFLINKDLSYWLNLDS